MRNKIIPVVILILIAGVTAGYITFYKNVRIFLQPVQTSTSTSPEVPPPLATSTPQTTEIKQGTREYKNTAFRFSVDYPDTLSATEYQEQGNALTATFVNSDDTESFEIYVTPYSQSQITSTEFQLDEPSATFNNPTNVVIDGTQATMFYGSNPIMGDTREVWFIKNGFLYEVATYKSLDQWLGTIMQSWQFI
jgi:hypothetical protein